MAKPHVPKMPTDWWLRKRVYLLFMVRELTSVFVAAYCVFLLFGLWRLRAGEDPWNGFLSGLHSPWSMGFHLIALAMALYHTVTFLNLAPKVLVLRRGEEKIPAFFIAGAHYVAWIVVSGALVWTILGLGGAP